MAVRWYGRQFTEKMMRTAEQRLSSFCDRICNDIKRDMAKPKSGKQGKQTTASAPGESPARQTSHLVRSIVHKRSGKLREKLGTNLKYGLGLELGTRPHTIKAKGKTLAWKGDDGETVFARSVKHPGIKARPWLRPALSRAKADFQQLWKDK